MKTEQKSIMLHEMEFVLRSPDPGDGEEFLALRKAASEQTEFLIRYPEEIKGTAKEYAEMLQRVKDSEEEIFIAAFDKGRMAGCVEIRKTGGQFKYRHRAGLGIALRKEYWNLGLGTELIRMALQEIRKTRFRQIELGVFAENAGAVHVYKKLGFEEWGRHPRAFQLKDGTFHDEIQMLLELS